MGQPDAPLRQAEALLEIGRHEQATVLVAGYLAEYPDSVTGLTLMAICRGLAGDIRTMEQTARRAVAMAPEDPWPRSVHVRALLAQNRHRQARREVGTLLGQASDDWRSHYLAAVAWSVGVRSNLGAALESAGRACGLAPDEPDVHALRGAILDRLGDNRAAKQAWRHALGLDPGHAAAQTQMSVSDLAAGRVLAGVRGLTESVRATPADEDAAANLRDAVESLAIRLAEWTTVGLVAQLVVFLAAGGALAATGCVPAVLGVLGLALDAVVVTGMLRGTPGVALRLALLRPENRQRWQQRNRLVYFGLIGNAAIVVCTALLAFAAVPMQGDHPPVALVVPFLVCFLLAVPLSIVAALRLVSRLVRLTFYRLRGLRLRGSRPIP